jgi:protein-disulfide isomerase
MGAAGFGGAAWYVNQPNPSSERAVVAPELADALMRPYSPVLGPAEAPVTIVEFLDPACEACRAFHPVVKDILDKNPEAVRVVIRYTPFHGPISDIAVKLLEAARMQGKFEQVLNALMAYQDAWAAHGAFNQQKLGKIAAVAGLDLELAIEQMKSPDIVAIVNQDKADVETMGVRQTPTFYINGKPLDPFGMDELRQQVDAEVAAVGS